jgi:hypothetical protein
LVTVIGCAGVVCPPLFALVLICGACLCSSCLGCPFLLCSLSKDGQRMPFPSAFVLRLSLTDGPTTSGMAGKSGTLGDFADFQMACLR